jgi:mRNA interferase MazF
VTSNPYGDPSAIELTHAEFRTGSLARVSYARPGKLFTANERLMVSQVAVLKEVKLELIIRAVISLLSTALTP